MTDLSKPVKTRDGRAARIICTDGTGQFPVVAMVEHPTYGEYPYVFNAEGVDTYRGDGVFDLVNLDETQPALTPEEFAEEMKRLSVGGDRHSRSFDPEEGHVEMDKLLCKVLVKLGYSAGVEIFKKSPKWYA